jgi:hypothetical protein
MPFQVVEHRFFQCSHRRVASTTDTSLCHFRKQPFHQALNRTQPILPLAPACQPRSHMAIWRYSRYWPRWRNRNPG